MSKESKWTIDGDSVSYKLNGEYTLHIVKKENGLSIKTIENDPPRGRTSVVFCRFLSNKHLGFEFTSESK